MAESFTPWSGFAGGLLIGLAATLLLYLNGRIAGISGILGGALSGKTGDLLWRLVFLAGLILGPLLFALATGHFPEIEVEASTALVVLGGLLVGFGTRMGSGCTSGHGVCGLSRGSPRSLAATIIFMAAAALTVFVLRHVVGG